MKTVIYIDKDLKDRAERVAMETTGEPLSTIVEKFLQDLCVRQNKLPSVNSSRRNRHLVQDDDDFKNEDSFYIDGISFHQAAMIVNKATGDNIFYTDPEESDLPSYLETFAFRTDYKGEWNRYVGLKYTFPYPNASHTIKIVPRTDHEAREWEFKIVGKNLPEDIKCSLRDALQEICGK